MATKVMRWGPLAFVAALAPVVLWAGMGWACTVLPAINLNQAYAPAGGQLELSGTSWPASTGVVSVRWDGLTGPLLAQTSANAEGVLGPVAITVPADAGSGFHFVVTEVPDQPGAVARAVVQVLGTGAAPVAAPQAALPAPAVPSPRGAGAGVAGLLLATGLGGLLLFGIGTATLIRSGSRRRVPAPSAVRRR